MDGLGQQLVLLDRAAPFLILTIRNASHVAEVEEVDLGHRRLRQKLRPVLEMEVQHLAHPVAHSQRPIAGHRPAL